MTAPILDVGKVEIQITRHGTSISPRRWKMGGTSTSDPTGGDRSAIPFMSRKRSRAPRDAAFEGERTVKPQSSLHRVHAF
jgi:hypothetical protein